MAITQTPPVRNGCKNSGVASSDWWQNETTKTWWFKNRDTKEPYKGPKGEKGDKGDKGDPPTLIFNSVEEMRGMSDSEVAGLLNGTYKSVTLLGYYEAGDTPGSIEYFISNTSDLEDGGGVFEVGGIKLEHVFKNRVNICYYGSVGDGLRQDGTIINRVLSKYKRILIVDGVYNINETIHNYSSMGLNGYYQLGNYTPVNGISIKTETKEGVFFKYDMATPDQIMLDLDGNKDGSGTTGNPASQIGNEIENITFIAGDLTGYGISLFANWEAKFKYIRFKGIRKSFILKGAAVADSATSNQIVFDKIICQNGDVGIECLQSRSGTINIINSEFRGMSNYGIVGTFATLSIDSSQIVACGNNSDNTTGGIRIMSGSTASQNRAINIKNCMFENNKWSDILLNNANGVSIDGNTFHPYFTIPTLVSNEQVCVRIDGVATYGVKGVSMNGNRIQPMANPSSGAEIVRFAKVSGNVRGVNIDGLSAPEDSHLPYLYDVSATVKNFYPRSFGASAGWKIDQSKVIAPFTGTNELVESRQTPLVENIELEWDNSSGITGTPAVVGSRFNSQWAYIVPWDGVYNISVECNLSGLTTGTHTSIKVNLIAGGQRRRIRDINGANVLTGTSKGGYSTTMKLPKGAEVYLTIQVTGTGKTVTVSESANYVPISLNITQIQ